MKKIIYISISVFLLCSCTTQKKLYSWNKYQSTSYNYLKNNDDKSTEELMKTYKLIIEKQTGTRGVVPPGIYADYGFLLLKANKTSEGKEMLQKEIELYPESKIFIDKILKKIEQ